MDLGNLLGDLGTAYINAKYANQPPTPSIQYTSSVAPTAGGISTTPAFSFNDIPVIGGTPCKRRRRRKRLATVSDIKDLAALKAVLGKGQAFTTWIATHS